MVIEKTVYRFLKTIRIVLEEVKDVEVLQREYDRISILAHTRLDLPGFTCVHKKTPIIDTTRTPEEIMLGFRDTSRNEARRALRTQGLAFVCDDQDFERVYALYSAHEFSQGRVPDRREEFKGCKLFSAYYQESLISSIICFDASPYLRAKAISSLRMEVFDKELYKVISNASRGLVYSICQWAHEHGYRGFDMGSINLKDQEKQGIAKFKASFGAEIVDEYTYSWRSPRMRILEKFVSVRLFFARLKRL